MCAQGMWRLCKSLKYARKRTRRLEKDIYCRVDSVDKVANLKVPETHISQSLRIQYLILFSSNKE